MLSLRETFDLSVRFANQVLAAFLTQGNPAKIVVASLSFHGGYRVDHTRKQQKLPVQPMVAPPELEN